MNPSLQTSLPEVDGQSFDGSRSSMKSLTLSDLCRGAAALFAVPRMQSPNAEAPAFVEASTVSRPAAKTHVTSVYSPGFIRSHGSGMSIAEAATPAIAEALERYCASLYRTENLLTARAADLGGECIDLDSIPTVSEREMAHPNCPIKKASKREAIRWVRGVSLTEMRPIFIPAIMVYSGLSLLLPGEHFWLPISTGCAAHHDRDYAIRAGIFEVAERDAISLLWHQQLPLPQIEIDYADKNLAAHLEFYQRASAYVEMRFFDATTDVGVPTVFGVRLASESTSAHTVVSCAAAPSFSEAIAKAMRDLVSVSPAFERPCEVPSSLNEFKHMMHGATYMARRENAPAFDFLLQQNDTVRLSEIDMVGSGSWSLRETLASFQSKGISIYAVDLTTDEARRVGMKVLRVVIPALQPLSFCYTAQYKGHPRLYEAPSQMGYTVHDEQNLNKWPQPFA